jgi:hypothetical protein
MLMVIELYGVGLIAVQRLHQEKGHELWVDWLGEEYVEWQGTPNHDPWHPRVTVL